VIEMKLISIYDSKGSFPNADTEQYCTVDSVLYAEYCNALRGMS